MELQQLRYFKALAESGNLTKTADRLHITPPTLSNSIARLEEDLDAKLFDRIKGRLYLNEVGKLFLESTSTILHVLDVSCNNIRNVSTLGKKIISVSTSVSSFALGDVFARYLELHPDVRLINRQSNVLSIETDLSENHFGFIITLDGSIDSKFLNSRLLSAENKVFCIGVSKNHPLAYKDTITLEDLRKERFIFPPSDLPLTKSFYSICRNAGFEPDVVAECNTFLLTRFVERGVGITFVTSQDFLNDEAMKLIPIHGISNFMQEKFTIYWAKNRTLSEAEQDFLEFITSYFKKKHPNFHPL